MQYSKRIAAILFVLGLILIVGFFTPFLHNDSGSLVHTHITFVGKLLVGRFLIYIALLIAACIAVILLGKKTKGNTY